MRYRRLYAILLGVMGCLTAQAQPGEGLLFGVLGNVPFAINVAGKPPSGLYVELMEAIIERAKIPARVESFPLARVLAQLRAGSIAATLVIPNDEILEIGVPVAEVAELESIVVGLKGTSVASYEELYGKNVCVLRGASFAPKLLEDSRIPKTEAYESGSCVRMLMAGHVDFVAAPAVALWWHLRAGTIERSQLGAPFTLNRRAVYLLVSKKIVNSALLNSLAEGVRLARSDGTVDAIVKKYER